MPPSHLATFSPASFFESRSWLPEQIRSRVLRAQPAEIFPDDDALRASVDERAESR